MFHCIFDFNIMKTDNRNNSISLQLQFWFPAFIKTKRDKAALFIGPVDGVHMTLCKIHVKDEESRANRRNNLVHRHVREGANTLSHVSCGYHEHSLKCWPKTISRILRFPAQSWRSLKKARREAGAANKRRLI